MRKKDIKRISKKIFKQLDNKNKGDKISIDMCSPVSDYDNNLCEYDEDVSNRFKKLFNNLIKYPDGIRLSYTSTHINIEVGDIKYIKKSRPVNNGMLKSNGDENLSIYIIKDNSFTITQGYSRVTKYNDSNMYNDLIEITRDCVKEINSNNFNTIYEDISRESGILRDSNLEDLLG